MVNILRTNQLDMSDCRPIKTSMLSIRLFLPVHNRGSLTGDFINHFRGISRGVADVSITVLDDGCTDHTLTYAKKCDPTITILKLGGKAFWGGALNAIRSTIIHSSEAESKDLLYMICNDDIRLLSAKGLSNALEMVRDDTIVAARTIQLSENTFLSDDHDYYKYEHSDLEPLFFFDVVNGVFKKTYNAEGTNIAPTRAILTTAAPWMKIDTIPPTLPHYLSDYWLTMDFTSKGSRIVYPSGFVCANHKLTSRNLPLEDCNHRGIFSMERIRLKAIAYVSPASPSYAPAWITFLERYCKSNYAKRQSRKLKVKLAISQALLKILASCELIMTCWKSAL